MTRRFQPYKFVVQAIVQELDAEGNVVGEAPVGVEGQPVVVFGVDGLKEWAEAFPSLLSVAAENA